MVPLNLLLDTHIWLWWMEKSSRLNPRAYEAIANPQNVVYVSSIAMWEVNLKVQLGKLKVDESLADQSQKRGLRFMPFTLAHAQSVINLPLAHRDPFDRALLAQARAERLNLVTADARLKSYAKEVDMLWVG